MLLPTSVDFLDLQAARHRVKRAVVFEDRCLSYADIAAGAKRDAEWLARRGIGAGDRVGIFIGNEPAILSAYYATWGVGAVAVPIAVRSTMDDAAHFIDHSRACALLCDDARHSVAREIARRTGICAFVLGNQISDAPRVLVRGSHSADRSARVPRPADLATITYTSGTTGSPKGVMITHANLLWSVLACSQARGDRPESVGAAISPLTHTPVLVSHVLCRLFLGATIVLFRKFDTQAILAATERYGITDLSLIGGMVFDIVQMGAVPDGVRRVVEKVTVGGAPTPMQAKRELVRIFDRAEIIEAYGQSEATDGVAMARGTSVFDREGTVGRPNPHVQIAIRRRDGSLAPKDEEGEIVIAGPTVMKGYYRNAEATRETIRDGWLHTGDLGRQDADGYLYLTGRVKELIITGGENVHPREVEDVLRLHPDVADVAVIGTPHPRWGEQVTAVVVPADGRTVDKEALIAFAGAKLSGFKRPRRVEIVDALPRNAAHKVQTGILKERFSSQPQIDTEICRHPSERSQPRC